jgi:hypothetical protein
MKHLFNYRKGERFFTLTMLVTSFIVCMVLFLPACSEDSKTKDNPYDHPWDPSQPVVVEGIGPQRGGYGTRVVVKGSNFGNDKEKISLYFNNKKALILKVQDNAIYAMVPKQPGDLSTIKVAVEDKEGVLEDVQFQYFIRSVVTTVAGVYRTTTSATPVDGPALSAVFRRPSKVSVDDEGNVLITDDDGGQRIRLLSLKEEKVTTVLNVTKAWSSSFNPSFSRYFVMERDNAQRPILFYALSKASGYMDADIYYDSGGICKDGSRPACALAADDEYVYMCTEYGNAFVRVHQETKKIELIGQLTNDRYQHMAYNVVDGKMYVSFEDIGKVYRFDPRYTPSGRTSPWITNDDLELVAGSSKGDPIEGNGENARLGKLCGMAADQEGNIYVADQANHCIWKIDSEKNATVFAGSKEGGDKAKGYRDGKPNEALFNRPYDVTATYDGLLYVADTFNYVVRCISIQ